MLSSVLTTPAAMLVQALCLYCLTAAGLTELGNEDSVLVFLFCMLVVTPTTLIALPALCAFSRRAGWPRLRNMSLAGAASGGATLLAAMLLPESTEGMAGSLGLIATGAISGATAGLLASGILSNLK